MHDLATSDPDPIPPALVPEVIIDGLFKLKKRSSIRDGDGDGDGDDAEKEKALDSDGGDGAEMSHGQEPLPRLSRPLPKRTYGRKNPSAVVPQESFTSTPSSSTSNAPPSNDSPSPLPREVSIILPASNVPEWFKGAHTYLRSESMGQPWVLCVNAYLAFETKVEFGTVNCKKVCFLISINYSMLT
jgi:hypothetical protein